MGARGVANRKLGVPVSRGFGLVVGGSATVGRFRFFGGQVVDSGIVFRWFAGASKIEGHLVYLVLLMFEIAGGKRVAYILSHSICSIYDVM